MANGTIAFDTLTTSDSVNTNTEKSIDTSYLYNGSSKSWVNLDGTDASATARDSFNVGSTTDNGTGNYTVTFSNNMTNDDYAHNVTARGSTVVFGAINDGQYATTKMGIYLFNTSGSLTDATYAIATLHGELA